MRMIGYQDLSLLYSLSSFAMPVFNLKLYCRLHRSKVNRNVVGVGDKATIEGKKSTRKVKALLFCDIPEKMAAC